VRAHGAAQPRPAYEEDEIETKTAGRVQRQEVLHRKCPPTLSFVVWEAALKLAYPEPQARAEQLRDLRACAELPGLTLQFLPLDAPTDAGLNGAFTLLETPDRGGQCVEVAAPPAAVHVRDSKNPEEPHFTVAPETWTAFLSLNSSPNEAI
jgi:hypothetical protein